MAKKKIIFTPVEALPTDIALTPEDFALVGTDKEASEQIVRKSMSYWQDAWRRLKKNKVAMVSLVVIVIMMVAALIIPSISPYGLFDQHYDHMNEVGYTDTEDGTHYLGTDHLGRDYTLRIFQAVRTSLLISLIVVAITMVTGSLIGLIAGYMGGIVDATVMRIIEVFNGIPYLMGVLLLSIVLGAGMWSLVIAFAIFSWTSYARMVRGQVLSLRDLEYVHAARSLGANVWRVILNHIFPNLLSIIIINVMMDIPSIIFAEATLSFLGLGMPVPEPSLGNMSSEGLTKILMYPYQLFLPSITICILTFSFYLFGDGLRDAFDPKLRK
jgi:oligopeptide transport system permease protein